MLANDYFAVGKTADFEIFDVNRSTAIDHEVQDLVEVTVIKVSIQTHRKGSAAHHLSHGLVTLIGRLSQHSVSEATDTN